MEEQSTAGMADAGVSEGSDNNTNSENTSPVLNSQDSSESNQEDSSNTEEVLPFGKHPRWQKMLKANREYQSRLQQMESQFQSLQGAASLDKWLRENPQKLEAVLALIKGEEQANSKAQPNYDAYEPDVAERFRKLDEIEKWRTDQEYMRQQEYHEMVHVRKAEVDEEFDQMLMQDGFLNADGSATHQKLVDAMGWTMRYMLQEGAKNPDMPTRAEVQGAYKALKEAISEMEEMAQKKALKRAIKTEAPLSGSKLGSPPVGKTTRTEHDRIMEIAGMI